MHYGNAHESVPLLAAKPRRNASKAAMFLGAAAMASLVTFAVIGRNSGVGSVDTLTFDKHSTTVKGANAISTKCNDKAFAKLVDAPKATCAMLPKFAAHYNTTVAKACKKPEVAAYCGCMCPAQTKFKCDSYVAKKCISKCGYCKPCLDDEHVSENQAKCAGCARKCKSCIPYAKCLFRATVPPTPSPTPKPTPKPTPSPTVKTAVDVNPFMKIAKATIAACSKTKSYYAKRRLYFKASRKMSKLYRKISVKVRRKYYKMIRGERRKFHRTMQKMRQPWTSQYYRAYRKFRSTRKYRMARRTLMKDYRKIRRKYRRANWRVRSKAYGVAYRKFRKASGMSPRPKFMKVYYKKSRQLYRSKKYRTFTRSYHKKMRSAFKKSGYQSLSRSYSMAHSTMYRGTIMRRNYRYMTSAGGRSEASS